MTNKGKKLLSYIAVSVCCFLPACADAASTPDTAQVVQIFLYDNSIKDYAYEASGVMLNDFRILTAYHVAQKVIDNPKRYQLTVCISGKINTEADCAYLAKPDNLSSNVYSEDFDLALLDLTGKFVSDTSNQIKNIKDWTADDYPKVQGINLASYGADISFLNISTGSTIQILGYPLGHNDKLVHSVGTVFGYEYTPDENATFVRNSAPINNGSSGSPVYDTDGKFVGLTMADWTNSKGQFIQGYFIAVSSINWWLENIINTAGMDKGSFPLADNNTITENYEALCRLGDNDYCPSNQALAVGSAPTSQEKITMSEVNQPTLVIPLSSEQAKGSSQPSLFQRIINFFKHLF